MTPRRRLEKIEMPKIKLSYDKRDDLPAGYEELYDEQDGKFVLTGVEGMKTEADITRLSTSLANERKEHKATKEKLRVFDGLDPEQVHEKLDRVEELEAEVTALKAKGDGKGGDEAIERIVETRVKRALAPVERERDQLKAKVGELETESAGLKGTISQGRIEGQVRKAADAAKVIAPAMEDVLLNAHSVFEITEDGQVVTKDGVPGVNPGLPPDVWMKDMQDKRPHWWATSVGGGANGSNGKLPNGAANPWSAAGWNLTEQGKYLRENGADKAGQLAKQAGTTVGGPKPAAKAA